MSLENSKFVNSLLKEAKEEKKKLKVEIEEEDADKEEEDETEEKEVQVEVEVTKCDDESCDAQPSNSVESALGKVASHIVAALSSPNEIPGEPGDNAKRKGEIEVDTNTIYPSLDKLTRAEKVTALDKGYSILKKKILEMYGEGESLEENFAIMPSTMCSNISNQPEVYNLDMILKIFQKLRIEDLRGMLDNIYYSLQRKVVIKESVEKKKHIQPISKKPQVKKEQSELQLLKESKEEIALNRLKLLSGV